LKIEKIAYLVPCSSKLRHVVRVDTRYWILDTGYWILDAGSSNFEIQFFGF